MSDDAAVDPLEIDVASSLVIERPIDDVSAFTLDPDNLPKWIKYASAAAWETSPPLRLGSRLRIDRSKRAGASSDVYEVCEFAPGEQVSWRTTDRANPLTMTFSWRAVGDRVTHMTVRYHVRGSGRWTAAAARVVMRRSMTADLARLKKALERDSTALL